MTAESLTSNLPQVNPSGMNAAYPFGKEDSLKNHDAIRRTKKDALLELIAQEMVTSLLGDDDDGIKDDDDEILKEFQAKLAKREMARKKRKSAEKRKLKEERLRQKQAADLARSEPIYVSNPEDIGKYESKLDDQDFDDDSFAGLGLEELVDPFHRGSLSSSCNGSQKSPISDSASFESTSKGSTMSVEEIREFVMANIPQAIRDQIPQDAWGEIFQGSKSGSKASSKRSSGSKPEKRVDSAPIAAVDPSSLDDISVMSDVTGFVNAFPDGRRVEKKLSMSYNDVKTYPCPVASVTSVDTSGHTEGSSIMDHSTSNEVAPSPVSCPAPGGPKSVSFGTVTLRYYERILTDNPAVQSGPAIGIGWRYKRAGLFEVDEFEQGRTGSRTAEELVLPREVREQMLKNAGFSQKDIAEMVRVILKTKNQRRQTINNLNSQGVEEAVELARRRVGRLLSFGKKSDIVA
ncbi:hypothetical protein IV203_036604 [Nitzschia inconspicua]|uniref:Uncharacterized protein n=1 Tax=Nitzschia inconspicua TaxID=303405 RepID=A0A9K3LH14_9STRA|nr:hypothetical protein IV203_036604 [Nitzschia inconspicua]